jgi:hypothetical protein
MLGIDGSSFETPCAHTKAPLNATLCCEADGNAQQAKLPNIDVSWKEQASAKSHPRHTYLAPGSDEWSRMGAEQWLKPGNESE